MKKILTVLTILTILLSFSVSNVFAQGYLTLLEVKNHADGQVTLLFRVTGTVDEQSLKQGVLTHSEGLYRIYCKLEGDLLSCNASRRAGGLANIILGRFYFWGINIPVIEDAPEEPNPQECKSTDGLNPEITSCVPSDTPPSPPPPPNCDIPNVPEGGVNPEITSCTPNNPPPPPPPNCDNPNVPEGGVNPEITSCVPSG
jgi:hypothetical protein